MHDLPMPLPPALAQPTRSTELLLDSAIPARIAWTSDRGAPRVAPMWFEWTGEELLLSSFAGARKLDDLQNGTRVAITIDTNSFPYRSLRMGGVVEVEAHSGLTDSYRRCADRYLGPTLGPEWCAALGNATQALLRLAPRWASASDMAPGDFLAGT